MNVLKEYLENNFTNFTFEELNEHFISKFGVYVKNEGNYYHFGYDQVEAKWSEEVTHHCRGTILQYKNSWKYVCRSFKKFFNHHEEKCPFKYDESFSNIKDGFLRQKVDGTLINLWYDIVSFVWRVSTTGTITPTKINDFDFTFQDLFFKLSKIPLEVLNHNFTYMFELCTPYNRIVTEYKKDSIYLLYVNDNDNGYYQAEEHNKLKPYCDKISSVSIDIFKSYKDIYDFVEETSKGDLYGKNSEGWILYSNYEPVAKFKNETYKVLHSLGAGEPTINVKRCVSLFFVGNLDDVYNNLPELAKELVDNISNNFKKHSENIQNVIEQVKDIENQKEYALKVKELIGDSLPFLSYFFQYKKTKIGFSPWLKTKKQNGYDYNFHNFVDVWKL